jgi:hypothetical protein
MRTRISFRWLALCALLLSVGMTRQVFGSRKTPQLFTFEEGDDTIAFWPPKTIRLVRRMGRGTRVCQSELPANGNMWTGRDLEEAFRSADVQESLRTTKAPYSADAPAKLTAGDHTITWASECDKCLAQPDGIKRLYAVLHTVAFNQGLLCQ